MCTDRIHALGRVVSHNRIAPDVDYLLQLEHVPYPKSLADLRSFLGALNWVRDYLPGIAAICSPLTDAVSRATNDPASAPLSRKGKRRQALSLSQEERSAFDRCIVAVRAAVAVDLVDPDVPLIVYVDACEAGYGAILLQRRESSSASSSTSSSSAPTQAHKIVGIVSKRFSREQLPYSVHKKEALALTLVTLRFWSLMRRATVFSDHRALEALSDPNAPKSVSGWAQTVAASGATVHFVEGSSNCFADWLSRLHTPPSGAEASSIVPIRSDRGPGGILHLSGVGPLGQLGLESGDEVVRGGGGVVKPVKSVKVRIVGLYSSTLHGYERNYSVFHKEMMAILRTLAFFHSFVFGRKINIFTDHKSIIDFLLAPANRTLSQWAILFRGYDMAVHHLPGSLNTLADTLSRALAYCIALTA